MKKKTSRRRFGANLNRTFPAEYVYQGKYSSGAGQINITPVELNLPLYRAVRPLMAKITMSLTGNIPAINVSEPILIKGYNCALQSDVVKVLGPYLVSTLPKTFTIHWPYCAPTQIADATRKILSIYDFGTDSKLGLIVTVRIIFMQGPDIPGKTVHLVDDEPVIKMPVTHQPFEIIHHNNRH